ncbi:hypothetical protein ACFFJY_17500 [Fictibacillus aquaticus]|uniref:Uncharacterized protein n=1 Tax=Fictibacillus aquaticus TaxID=2021314 RepID=A0A235F640_9BACL|nr:hypothetical protein [Fictibacillus aquaticus]OYD56658.1 hypothetical protein CGZ90_16750 [Fictibacillus aquaticus]
MGILAMIVGFGVVFSVTNILFSFLYLISYSAGKGLYQWIIRDIDFLELLVAPFLGLTYYIANKLFGKFNWFNARILLVVYALFMLIPMIGFSYLFDAAASK